MRKTGRGVELTVRTLVYYDHEVPDRPVPDMLKGLVMPGLALRPLTTGPRTRKELANIDPGLIETVEEAYAYNTENPDPRLETDPEKNPFATRDEAEDYLSDMRAYAYHRKDL